MNRGDAYSVLAAELQGFSLLGYNALVSKIGCTASRLLRIGREDVTIEMTVGWNDVSKRTIRVTAIAFGPTCYKIERLDESIIVRPTLDSEKTEGD